jgi:hypothetical protein
MNPTTMMAMARRAAAVLLLAIPLATFAAEQKTFATPEAAVDALMAALKADDDAAIVAIFGDTHKDLVVTPDRAANSATRAKDPRCDADASRARRSRSRQARRADRRSGVADADSARAARRGAWRFATSRAPTSSSIAASGATSATRSSSCAPTSTRSAQYASRDRDGDNVLQYAQRLGSSPGKHDGLYWPADAANGTMKRVLSGRSSPRARDISRGTRKAIRTAATYFKILTRQGKSAPGGAYNYVINGRMLAGFAMVAYPAQYGDSGDDDVHREQQRQGVREDLGRIRSVGAAMTTFDPSRWKEFKDCVPCALGRDRRRCRLIAAIRALRRGDRAFDAANARRSESRSGRRPRCEPRSCSTPSAYAMLRASPGSIGGASPRRTLPAHRALEDSARGYPMTRAATHGDRACAIPRRTGRRDPARGRLR